MTINQVEAIYNNSKKIYRQITSKQFLKWFYNIFLGSLLVFIIFIIIGLIIPIKPNGLILLFTGIGIGVVSLITFYVVEYIRRKAMNFYKKEFTFANLYSDFLYQEKLIDSPVELDADFDNSFYRQHLEIFSRQFQFVNLDKNYATYKVFIKQQLFHLSYCNAMVVAENSKLLTGNKKAFHLIISSNYSGNIDGIICIENKYNHNQIDVWKKRVYKGYDIYSENDLSAWKEIIKVFDKFNSKNILVTEIKIKANKIFYTFDFSKNNLLIKLSNVKFYKSTWKNLFDQFQNLQTDIKNIFETIQLLQQ